GSITALGAVEAFLGLTGRAALRAELPGVVGAALGADPLPSRGGPLGAALGAELSGIGILRPTGTGPSAGRSRRSRSGRLALHLLLVCLGESPGHPRAGLHPHIDAHKPGSGPISVGTGSLKATGHGSLNVTLPDSGVAEHSALVAHIDELLGFRVIGD